MSLILDALRKSEAERRRGQAPSIYAPSPVPGTRLRPAWTALAAGAGGVLLLLAVAVYWWRDDTPVTKEELVEDAPSLVPAEATLAGAPPAPPPPPADAVAIAPLPAPSTAPGAPPAGVDALVKPAPVPPIDAPPAPKTIEATPPGAPAPEPAASAPAEEALPPLAVLDPATRGGLPPLKLSMHVYNVDPARRFAIIDGQRVSEGAQIGAAIVLSIRRDGVVLDVAGKRVLLAKP